MDNMTGRAGFIQWETPETDRCEAHPQGCRLTGAAYIAAPRPIGDLGEQA